MSAAVSVGEAISEGGCSLDVIVDGQPLVVVFSPDVAEHKRRTELATGAVTSRRLLHALWAVPAGLTWPTSAVAAEDVRTLEREGHGFATVRDGHVERHFQPAGQVEAIVTFRRRLSDAVAAAAAFPPVFRRYAVARHMPKRPADTFGDAERYGVGVLFPDGSHGPVRAVEPIVGVPAVYRWWFAEVAYRAWLPNAH